MNTFLGQNAGGANLTATGNTYVGSGAGVENETGELNVASGYLAAAKNKTGSYNVAYGTTASYSNVAGNNNAAFGHNAGYNSRGSYNAFFGSDADVMERNGQPLILSNATAIGANAKVSVSNALVLGDSVAGTKVGIGVTAPMFALDVKGVINLRSKGTIRYSSLTNPNLRNGTTDYFLTVNADGETVLAKYRLRVDSPNDWADRVFLPGYNLRPLAEVERYIKQNGHLPGIPSAQEVVDKGVDAASITAKLLEKVEELTLHMIELQKENKRLRELVESGTSGR